MNFKQFFYAENDRLHQPASATELSQEEKVIFLQKLAGQIADLLEEGETIQGYLPMTSGDSIAITNAGIAGYAYARKEDAKKYIELFKETRGNRLLVFTEKRMLFLAILDFLEEGSWFSYPYETIDSFFIQPKTINYRDEKIKKQKIVWYYLDFQAGKQIFSDLLTEKNAGLFKEFHEQIPALQKVPFGKKIYRRKLLDRVTSNFGFLVSTFKIFNILLIILAIVLVTWTLYLYFTGKLGF